MHTAVPRWHSKAKGVCIMRVCAARAAAAAAERQRRWIRFSICYSFNEYSKYSITVNHFTSNSIRGYLANGEDAWVSVSWRTAEIFMRTMFFPLERRTQWHSLRFWQNVMLLFAVAAARCC